MRRLLFVLLIGCCGCLPARPARAPETIFVTVHSDNYTVTRLLLGCGDARAYVAEIRGLAFLRTVEQRVYTHGCEHLVVTVTGPITNSQVSPTFSPVPTLDVWPGATVWIEIPRDINEVTWRVM